MTTVNSDYQHVNILRKKLKIKKIILNTNNGVSGSILFRLFSNCQYIHTFLRKHKKNKKIIGLAVHHQNIFVLGGGGGVVVGGGGRGVGG